MPLTGPRPAPHLPDLPPARTAAAREVELVAAGAVVLGVGEQDLARGVEADAHDGVERAGADAEGVDDRLRADVRVVSGGG